MGARGTLHPRSIGRASCHSAGSVPLVATTGIGRNVDLFGTGLRWAGRQANASLPVLPALHAVNAGGLGVARQAAPAGTQRSATSPGQSNATGNDGRVMAGTVRGGSRGRRHGDGQAARLDTRTVSRRRDHGRRKTSAAARGTGGGLPSVALEPTQLFPLLGGLALPLYLLPPPIAAPEIPPPEGVSGE